MITRNGKLEPRGDNEPKFDKHNKTDRKILITVCVTIAVLLAIIIALFMLYFFVLRQ